MRILVTGGCGFIGSNFIRLVLAQCGKTEIVNLDKLIFIGVPDNDLLGKSAQMHHDGCACR